MSYSRLYNLYLALLLLIITAVSIVLLQYNTNTVQELQPGSSKVLRDVKTKTAQLPRFSWLQTPPPPCPAQCTESTKWLFADVSASQMKRLGHVLGSPCQDLCQPVQTSLPELTQPWITERESVPRCGRGQRKRERGRRKNTCSKASKSAKQTGLFFRDPLWGLLSMDEQSAACFGMPLLSTFLRDKARHGETFHRRSSQKSFLCQQCLEIF